jgi:hypothetical protein
MFFLQGFFFLTAFVFSTGIGSAVFYSFSGFWQSFCVCTWIDDIAAFCLRVSVRKLVFCLDDIVCVFFL